jgi:RHS repeat-associated protein
MDADLTSTASVSGWHAVQNYLINWGDQNLQLNPPLQDDLGNFYDSVYYKGEEITLSDGFESNPEQTLSIGARIDVPVTPVDNNWTKTVHFYDKYGRQIQTISTNHIRAQYSVSDIEYDFVGKTLNSRSILYEDSNELYKIEKRFEYDHAQRLKQVYHNINEQGEILLVQNNYNALGQLIQKRLHSTDFEPDLENATFLETVDYRYNIRGWLKQINGNGFDDRLFGMDFYYNEGYEDLDAPPQMNGNISAVEWQTASGDMIKRVYGYDYDDINQLKQAKFAHFNADNLVSSNTYTVDGLEYDLNGNILAVNRKGLDGENGYIDKLQYHYNGNKLIAVNDEVSVHNNDDFFDNGMIQHPENPDFTPEYEYDRNGNLICDKNKNMYISYNHLNLPVTVDFGNGNRIEWVYDAGGAKLRKTVFHENEESYFQDYLGGISWRTTFTDGIGVRELEYIVHDEGKIKHNDNGFYYVYDYKDHLGNVRLSFKEDDNGDANIVQEDHYYPFGMRLAGLSTNIGNDNKHLYNGKELEEDFNLHWYHYGARYYDPQLGRWHAVDPADEFHSPYVYVGNNPVNFVDPDGKETIAAQHQRVMEIILWSNPKENQIWGLFDSFDEMYRRSFWGEYQSLQKKYGTVTFFTSDINYLNSEMFQLFARGKNNLVKSCVNLLSMGVVSAQSLLKASDPLLIILQALGDKIDHQIMADFFLSLENNNIKSLDDLENYNININDFESLDNEDRIQIIIDLNNDIEKE